MPPRSLAQVDAELRDARRRKQADVDKIADCLTDISRVEYAIDQLLEERAEIAVGQR